MPVRLRLYERLPIDQKSENEFAPRGGNIILGFTVRPFDALMTVQSSVVELFVTLRVDGVEVPITVTADELTA